MRALFKKITARRSFAIAAGLSFGALIAGTSYAVSSIAGHGGPKPRVHDSSVCDLVDTSTLEGNWTHGDYVNAVTDPAKKKEAAKSDCGKPDKGARGAKVKDKAKTGED